MTLKSILLGTNNPSFFPQCRSERKKLLTALALILMISCMHYLTEAEAINYHNVARRLYYLPIVISAFALGVRGGLLASVVVTFFYFPHAFLMEHHHDPAPGIDKFLELILYFVVGTITGFLVQKERKVTFDLQTASRKRDDLQTQLIQASKMTALGELSSGLAHEIRNPLASILGSAEALSSEFDEGHKKRRIADLLISEIGRLNAVVSRFLTFAKPGKPKRERLKVSDLLDHTVEILPDASRCSIASENRDGFILADANQIQQVLLNLALNGLASGDDARIRFETLKEDVGGKDYFRISLRDDGEGVDDRLAHTLFDPFVTSRSNGSGLGLSISKQIMDVHGGFIEFESSVRGSVFHLYFPAEEVK